VEAEATVVMLVLMLMLILTLVEMLQQISCQYTECRFLRKGVQDSSFQPRSKHPSSISKDPSIQLSVPYLSKQPSKRSKRGKMMMTKTTVDGL
jgi:hypothetical protein